MDCMMIPAKHSPLQTCMAVWRDEELGSTRFVEMAAPSGPLECT